MNVLERDFFTDPELLQDPTPYYAALQERGPVWREPHKGVFMVSGMEQVLEVFADHERFSAIVAALGPLLNLPKPEPGESVGEVIERRRNEIPLSNELPSLDPPRHTRLRTLIGRLFTPNRLKENEEFMWTLADELINEFADRREADFREVYARPFTMLVVADLMGVPREDHKVFRGWLSGARGTVGDPDGEFVGDRVFANLHPYFTRYIEQRRASPGEDAMSRLAGLRYADGALPEVVDLVRLAAILFAAGQETTAHLLAAGMRIFCEQPALADELRSNPAAIPNFVEELLRLESPVKGSFRLALKDTTLAGVQIPAGAMLDALIGAANREPSIFKDPYRFDAKRANARRNVSFGYGEHFCPGSNLARVEARISFERLLARLDDLKLVNPGALSYLPTFILRGMTDLPLRFRPRT